MDMVTGIWDVAVVAIITDGAEAVVITMDGTGDGTTDAINSELEAALVTGVASHGHRLQALLHREPAD
jgi:hypothetical protein